MGPPSLPRAKVLEGNHPGAHIFVQDAFGKIRYKRYISKAKNVLKKGNQGEPGEEPGKEREAGEERQAGEEAGELTSRDPMSTL